MSKPDPQWFEHQLGELMAVIHGDGGHYVEANGWEKAMDKALEELNDLRTYVHGNHNYRVFYEDLVGQISGDYGEAVSQHGPLMAGRLAAEKACRAFETLRSIRSSVLMELRRGYVMDNTPEVEPTAKGIVDAMRRCMSDHAAAARTYEKNLVMDWLDSHPSDAIRELAFGEGDNPYRWLVEALRDDAHRGDPYGDI